MKRRQTIMLLLGSAAPLILTSCQEAQPDFGPIGDGMRALGICVVVASVVTALASLIRSEQRKNKNASRRQDDQGEGG